MFNIKQLIIKFTLSFISLFILNGCQTNIINTHNNSIIEKVQIAILMPLSGPQAGICEEYIKLIKMGLADGLNTNVDVTVYDGSTVQVALSAMNKIIAKKTKIILGPLTSPITSAIAPRAKDADIIIITMSNNPVLADDKLLVFGHAPLKQLKSIMDYLLANNYTNFITLLPSGSHSQNINKIIQNRVLTDHATLVRSEFYNPTPESISKAVTIVANAVDNLNEVDNESLSKPVVYLGDDQTTLNIIFDSLKLHHLDQKSKIAGDNRVDFYYPKNIDISFTSSLNILNSNIKQKAANEGISYITFMHALAYDLGKITTHYIGDHYNEQRFINRLNSKVPYIGISGNIYFIDNIAQREYDIISKEAGEFTTLSTSGNTIK